MTWEDRAQTCRCEAGFHCYQGNIGQNGGAGQMGDRIVCPMLRGDSGMLSAFQQLLSTQEH